MSNSYFVVWICSNLYRIIPIFSNDQLMLFSFLFFISTALGLEPAIPTTTKATTPLGMSVRFYLKNMHMITQHCNLGRNKAVFKMIIYLYVLYEFLNRNLRYWNIHTFNLCRLVSKMSLSVIHAYSHYSKWSLQIILFLK